MLFTISQNEDFPSTLLRASKTNNISNEALNIEFGNESDSFVLNITQDNLKRKFQFGLGMYISGSYLNGI